MAAPAPLHSRISRWPLRETVLMWWYVSILPKFFQEPGIHKPEARTVKRQHLEQGENAGCRERYSRSAGA